MPFPSLFRSAAVRAAAVMAGAVLAAGPAAAQQGAVRVAPSHVQSLALRLDSLAATLPAPERALWQGVLRRAAAAPAASADVRVSPILEIGPGGGCDGGPGVDEAGDRVAIIVQGGRTAGAPAGIIVQGGRAPSAVPGGRTPVRGGRAGGRPGTPAADEPRPGGTGAVAIGPKQDDPGRPGGTGVVAIGPKQDDPGRPGGTGVVAIGPKQDDPGRPGGTGVVAIGPKQDDPAPPPQSLGRRLAEFSVGLPAEERAALDWLLTRAAGAPQGRHGTPGGLASTPAPEDRPGRPGGLRPGAVPGGRPGTPGGLPPGRNVTLRQALGIDPLAIGPKQDDPTPPPPARGWVLRY